MWSKLFSRTPTFQCLHYLIFWLGSGFGCGIVWKLKIPTLNFLWVPWPWVSWLTSLLALIFVSFPLFLISISSHMIFFSSLLFPFSLSSPLHLSTRLIITYNLSFSSSTSGSVQNHRIPKRRFPRTQSPNPSNIQQDIKLDSIFTPGLRVKMDLETKNLWNSL